MTYFKGQWNADCQRCGFTKLSSEIRKEWTGLRVCRECFETRHPQDFVRGVPDDQTLPWASPTPAYVFVPDNYLREDGGLILREDGSNLFREVE